MVVMASGDITEIHADPSEFRATDEDDLHAVMLFCLTTILTV